MWGEAGSLRRVEDIWDSVFGFGRFQQHVNDPNIRKTCVCERLTAAWPSILGVPLSVRVRGGWDTHAGRNHDIWEW
jgi:hypothetical protein